MDGHRRVDVTGDASRQTWGVGSHTGHLAFGIHPGSRTVRGASGRHAMSGRRAGAPDFAATGERRAPFAGRRAMGETMDVGEPGRLFRGYNDGEVVLLDSRGPVMAPLELRHLLPAAAEAAAVAAAASPRPPPHPQASFTLVREDSGGPKTFPRGSGRRGGLPVQDPMPQHNPLLSRRDVSHRGDLPGHGRMASGRTFDPHAPPKAFIPARPSEMPLGMAALTQHAAGVPLSRIIHHVASSEGDPEKGQWDVRGFPQAQPTGRQDVWELKKWLDGSLEVLKEDIAKSEWNRVETKRKGLRKRRQSAGHSLLQEEVAETKEEVDMMLKAYDTYGIAFAEMVRQVSLTCVERGSLLEQLFEGCKNLWMELLGINNKYLTKIESLLGEGRIEVEPILSENEIDLATNGGLLGIFAHCKKCENMTRVNSGIQDLQNTLRDSYKKAAAGAAYGGAAPAPPLRNLSHILTHTDYKKDPADTPVANLQRTPSFRKRASFKSDTPKSRGDRGDRGDKEQRCMDCDSTILGTEKRNFCVSCSAKRGLNTKWLRTMKEAGLGFDNRHELPEGMEGAEEQRALISELNAAKKELFDVKRERDGAVKRASITEEKFLALGNLVHGVTVNLDDFARMDSRIETIKDTLHDFRVGGVNFSGGHDAAFEALAKEGAGLHARVNELLEIVSVSGLSMGSGSERVRGSLSRRQSESGRSISLLGRPQANDSFRKLSRRDSEGSGAFAMLRSISGVPSDKPTPDDLAKAVQHLNLPTMAASEERERSEAIKAASAARQVADAANSKAAAAGRPEREAAAAATAAAAAAEAAADAADAAASAVQGFGRADAFMAVLKARSQAEKAAAASSEALRGDPRDVMRVAEAVGAAALSTAAVVAVAAEAVGEPSENTEAAALADAAESAAEEAAAAEALACQHTLDTAEEAADVAARAAAAAQYAAAAAAAVAEALHGPFNNAEAAKASAAADAAADAAAGAAKRAAVASAAEVEAAEANAAAMAAVQSARLLAPRKHPRLANLPPPEILYFNFNVGGGDVIWNVSEDSLGTQLWSAKRWSFLRGAPPNSGVCVAVLDQSTLKILKAEVFSIPRDMSALAHFIRSANDEVVAGYQGNDLPLPWEPTFDVAAAEACGIGGFGRLLIMHAESWDGPQLKIGDHGPACDPRVAGELEKCGGGALAALKGGGLHYSAAVEQSRDTDGFKDKWRAYEPTPVEKAAIIGLQARVRGSCIRKQVKLLSDWNDPGYNAARARADGIISQLEASDAAAASVKTRYPRASALDVLTMRSKRATRHGPVFMVAVAGGTAGGGDVLALHRAGGLGGGLDGFLLRDDSRGGLFFPVSSQPVVAMDLQDLDGVDAHCSLGLPLTAQQEQSLQLLTVQPEAPPSALRSSASMTKAKSFRRLGSLKSQKSLEPGRDTSPPMSQHTDASGDEGGRPKRSVNINVFASAGERGADDGGDSKRPKKSLTRKASKRSLSVRRQSTGTTEFAEDEAPVQLSRANSVRRKSTGADGDPQGQLPRANSVRRKSARGLPSQEEMAPDTAAPPPPELSWQEREKMRATVAEANVRLMHLLNRHAADLKNIFYNYTTGAVGPVLAYTMSSIQFRTVMKDSKVALPQTLIDSIFTSCRRGRGDGSSGEQGLTLDEWVEAITRVAVAYFGAPTSLGWKGLEERAEGAAAAGGRVSVLECVRVLFTHHVLLHASRFDDNSEDSGAFADAWDLDGSAILREHLAAASRLHTKLRRARRRLEPRVTVDDFVALMVKNLIVDPAVGGGLSQRDVARGFVLCVEARHPRLSCKDMVVTMDAASFVKGLCWVARARWALGGRGGGRGDGVPLASVLQSFLGEFPLNGLQMPEQEQVPLAHASH